MKSHVVIFRRDPQFLAEHIKSLKSDFEVTTLINLDSPKLLLTTPTAFLVANSEALTELKSALAPKSPDVRYVVISALASLQDELTAFDNGADQYIHSPVEYTVLRARLNALFRGFGLFQKSNFFRNSS